MTTPMKFLDVEALTVDLPEYKLWRGQVGTVVEILAGGAAVEGLCCINRCVFAVQLSFRHQPCNCPAGRDGSYG